MGKCLTKALVQYLIRSLGMENNYGYDLNHNLGAGTHFGAIL